MPWPAGGGVTRGRLPQGGAGTVAVLTPHRKLAHKLPRNGLRARARPPPSPTAMDQLGREVTSSCRSLLPQEGAVQSTNRWRAAPSGQEAPPAAHLLPAGPRHAHPLGQRGAGWDSMVCDMACPPIQVSITSAPGPLDGHAVATPPAQPCWVCPPPGLFLPTWLLRGQPQSPQRSSLTGLWMASKVASRAASWLALRSWGSSRGFSCIAFNAGRISGLLTHASKPS